MKLLITLQGKSSSCCLPTFLGNCKLVSKMATPYSYSATCKDPTMLYPCQHLVLSVFLIVAYSFNLHFYSDFMLCIVSSQHFLNLYFSLVRCVLRIMGCFLNMLLSFKSFVCFEK